MAVGNLEFIKSASGTSVSSLSITDCFSDKYDVYVLSIAKEHSDTDGSIRLKFIDSGGSTISDLEYDSCLLNMGASYGFLENRYTGLGYINRAGVSGNTIAESTGNITYIYNPYNSSSYTFTQMQDAGVVALGFFGGKGIGVHKSAEQLTGLVLEDSSGTFGFIEASVYGVK
jgi:hypothetical protein